MKKLTMPLLAGFVTIVGLWMICELLLLALHVVAPGRLFGNHAAYSKKLQALSQEQYDEYVTSMTPPYMWSPKPNSTVQIPNCKGEVFSANYDRIGSRTYRGYSHSKAQVLLVGDSYTHGDEVGDNDTIAAHLHSKHGIMSANLGVGGYSSVQALMMARRKTHEFKNAHTVVLGVMFENIRRNVNSNSATFVTTSVFGVRPFVKDSNLVSVSERASAGRRQFQQLAEDLYAQDFWRRPDAEFPFALSLADLVTSRAFVLRATSLMNKTIGSPQYSMDYSDEQLAEGLRVTTSAFIEWAKTAKVNPMVVFIPQNKFDRVSPIAWISRHAEAKQYFHVIDDATIDWDRYNQLSNGACHPSSYGYEKIAQAYAALLARQ